MRVTPNSSRPALRTTAGVERLAVQSDLSLTQDHHR